MTEERRGHRPMPRGGDPLDREIRRLLAVDPSPAFEARVRARVAAEPVRSDWRRARLWMAFGTAAALAVAVARFGPEPPADVGDGSGLGTERAAGNAPSSSGTAARAVSLPVVPAEPPLPEPAFPRALEAGTAPRVGLPVVPAEPPLPEPAFPRALEAGTAPRAVGLPVVPAAPNAPEPASPRALEAGFRVATDPPRRTAAPPGPPRFTRVVFSESERGAIRRLLAQAGNRPVVVPVTAEARTAVAGERPAEPDIRPVALGVPPGLEIPPIAIEPLNLALLDTGAAE